MRQARVLRMRFDVAFAVDRPRMTWNARVAQEVRLPTWSFEVKERGTVVFVRAEQETTAGTAVARLFLHEATDEAPAQAHVEVGVTGRWREEHERAPPVAAVDGLVEEAEALMVLLGCHAPRARFAEAYRTKD